MSGGWAGISSARVSVADAGVVGWPDANLAPADPGPESPCSTRSCEVSRDSVESPREPSTRLRPATSSESLMADQSTTQRLRAVASAAGSGAVFLALLDALEISFHFLAQVVNL